MQRCRQARNIRTPSRRVHLEECVERLERTPKVHIANAVTSASDISTVARAANTIRIKDLATVLIEIDCKNREDTHQDRLDQEGLRHTRSCMHRGHSNVVETLNAFEETEHLERANHSKQAERGCKGQIRLHADSDRPKYSSPTHPTRLVTYSSLHGAKTPSALYTLPMFS